MPIELKPLSPRDAIAALEARGVQVPSFAWQEVYAAEHANMFTVAKSTGYKILTDIYEALQTALAEGKTYEQFAAELTPVLQAKGWWGRKIVRDPHTGLPTTAQLGSPRRLKLIFDANMRTSYAAGHWASFERNKRARPFLRYVHLEGQEHPRHLHHLWHNTVLPIDHPWWKTHGAPNGWHCHCIIQSLSQRDIDRLIAQGENLKFEAPTIDYQVWTNKVTGEERAVPVGIDPGWDHNPGLAGATAAANRDFAQALVAAPDALADVGVRDRLASDAFKAFIASPHGLMPAMALHREVADVIGLEGRIVLLSEQTMLKQFKEHHDLTLADYQALRVLGAQPDLVVQDKGQNIVLLKREGNRWRFAVIKGTATGQAAFVTSYRWARQAAFNRLMAKPGRRILIDYRK